jgi:putative peptide maturation dehydrogenase
VQLRRTAYAFFYLEDDVRLDLAALLQGRLPEPEADTSVLALSILTGERHRLERPALDLLLSVPATRWIDAGGHERALVDTLNGYGLLLTDGDDGTAHTLRERDEALSATQWNVYAALYHYMTQWSGIEIRAGDEDDVALSERTRTAAQALRAAHGPPPDAFAPPRGGPAVALPGRVRSGPLYDALLARQTTRTFESPAPMSLEDLDTILTYVFGCHGFTRTAADVVCIKRTSPSGGGLHPIEVYPIVTHVEGLDPGIYHYRGRDHALYLLVPLSGRAAREAATDFMCGQSYFGAAHVSFVLTARFYRNHWKYRRHQKAYAGMLMDAAHLSQTLYLVSADLGLGAYVTIAINARDIERRLGLDGVSEGVLAMMGCGRRGPGRSPLEPRFSPGPPP